MYYISDNSLNSIPKWSATMIFTQQSLVTLNNSSQMESTFWPRGRKGKGALESSTEGTAISASKGFEAGERLSRFHHPLAALHGGTLWKHFVGNTILGTQRGIKHWNLKLQWTDVLWFQFWKKNLFLNMIAWLNCLHF